MKRLVLFIIVVLMLAAGTSHAQQVPNAPIGTTTQENSAAQAPNTPPMTPREIALMRADILMARKDYGGAAKAYQDLLKDDPKNGALLNKTGMAYQLNGDSDEAERFYKKAIRADKTSWNAINNLGSVEYGRERYGKVILLAAQQDPLRLLLQQDVQVGRHQRPLYQAMIVLDAVSVVGVNDSL